MADKTDPTGLAALAAKPITIPVGVLLALLGPFVGVLGAQQMDTRDAQIAGLRARIERNEATIAAAALADVELRSSVARLADTLGEVRRIEEAAHPRVGVPRNTDNP
jgi:hypothetical protein